MDTKLGGGDGLSFVRFTNAVASQSVLGKIDTGTFLRLSDRELENVLSEALARYQRT